MARIFDCFTFFNELDVLEIRLAELNDVVDHFVIVEATLSFSGKPKPLVFQENAARFARYADKIIHVVVDDMPVDTTNAWDREYFQRNAIMRGLLGAAPDDIVMISDADEIPRAAVISEIMEKNLARGSIVLLLLDQFCFRMNLKAKGFVWSKGTRLLEKEHVVSPQEVRALRVRTRKKAYQKYLDPLRLRLEILSRFRRKLTPRFVPNAGWHFGFMGGTDAIRLKIQSYSHQELNRAELLSDSYIERRLADRRFFSKDLDLPLTVVAVDASFPRHLRENLERFLPHLQAEEPASTRS